MVYRTARAFVKTSMQSILSKVVVGLLWTVSTILGLTAGVFAVAFLISSFPVNRGFAQALAEDSIEIFVTSNGVHTDLVVPVATAYTDWRDRLPLHHYAAADSSYTYIAFGWGDRRFYMETPEWTDLTPEVAIPAALWPTRTAMHVAYVAGSLEANERQRPIRITPEQYVHLIRYIEASFREENGQFILIPGAGYTAEDNFYEAHGRFYALNNCNNWVNKGLKKAGVKTAAWAMTPYAIMRHLR